MGVDIYRLRDTKEGCTEYVLLTDFNRISTTLDNTLLELAACRKALKAMASTQPRVRLSLKKVKPCLIGHTKSGSVITAHPTEYNVYTLCDVRCECGFDFKTRIGYMTRASGSVRCRTCVRRINSERTIARRAKGGK